MSSSSGTLWVVATPLGNPGDLSPRGARVLAGAEVVLAEDTRRAGLLFQRLGIEASGRFVSYYEHNETARVPQVLEALRAGQDVALISDAGTPLMSDPGYRLVRAAREQGLAVSPVPGPMAAVAALSASGLPPQPFVFLGFLSRKAGERQRQLAAYARVPASLVFYERKSRVREALADAFFALGERECCVCRELTKIHETFMLTSLAAWEATSGETPGGEPLVEELPELRGEITVCLGPPAADERVETESVEAVIAEEASRGGKPKDVAKRVAARLPGLSPKAAYERMQAGGPAPDNPSDGDN